MGSVVLVGEGDFDGEPGDELDGDVFGGLWRVFGCSGELPHVDWGRCVEIFKRSFPGQHGSSTSIIDVKQVDRQIEMAIIYSIQSR